MSTQYIGRVVFTDQMDVTQATMSPINGLGIQGDTGQTSTLDVSGPVSFLCPTGGSLTIEADVPIYFYATHGGTILTDGGPVDWGLINNTPTTATGYGIVSIDNVVIGGLNPVQGTFSTINGYVPGTIGLQLLHTSTTNAAQAIVGTPFSTPVAMSGNLTASGIGKVYQVTTGSSSLTLTLPTATTGTFYIVTKIDTGSGNCAVGSVGTLFKQGDTIVTWGNGSGSWDSYFIFGYPLTSSRGGTGVSSTTDGQLLIGNSSTSQWTLSQLSAGTGISLANGHGSITVSSDPNYIQWPNVTAVSRNTNAIWARGGDPGGSGNFYCTGGGYGFWATTNFNIGGCWNLDFGPLPPSPGKTGYFRLATSATYFSGDYLIFTGGIGGYLSFNSSAIPGSFSPYGIPYINISGGPGNTAHDGDTITDGNGASAVVAGTQVLTSGGTSLLFRSIGGTKWFTTGATISLNGTAQTGCTITSPGSFTSALTNTLFAYLGNPNSNTVTYPGGNVYGICLGNWNGNGISLCVKIEYT